MATAAKRDKKGAAKRADESDEEIGLGPSSINPKFLDDFRKQKEEIHDCIQVIKSATASIQALTQQAMTAFTPEQHDRHRNEVQQHIRKAQAETRKGKGLLDEMKAKGHRLVAAAGESGSAELRLQRSQYMEACQAYMEAVQEHQQAKADFKDVLADRAVQQAKVVFPDMNEEEIQEKLERDPDAVQRQLEEPEYVANHRVQEAYDEAMSRARDVAQVMRSVKEVADMVQDLAAVVQQQSEMLNRIDQNVEQAAENVRKGNQQIEKAIAHSKKTRKWMCCIACCFIILIIIFLSAGLPILTSS